MKLRPKILLLVLATSLLHSLLVLGLYRLVILPGFTDLEAYEAERNLSRCEAALKNESNHLLTLCTDWAVWDDSYAYLQHPDSEYETSNLVLSTFEDNELSFLGLFDLSGAPVWAGWLQEDALIQGLPPYLPALPAWASEVLTASSDEDVRKGRAGLLGSSHGFLLVAMCPVTDSESTQAPVGTLVMIRLLTPKLLNNLNQLTQLDFLLWPLSATQGTGTPFPPLEEMYLNKSVLTSSGPDTLLVNSLITGLDGQLAGLLQIRQPQFITQRGQLVLRTVTLTGIVGAVTVLLVLLLLLQHYVIRPVLALSHAAVSYQSSSSTELFDLRMPQDELSDMAGAFQSLVQRLEDAQRRLAEDTYQAGQAQLAQDLLHNLRNHLVPVVARIDELGDRIRAIPLRNIQQAQAELQDPATPEARAADLRTYTRQALEHGWHEQQDFLDLLHTVETSLSAIETLLNRQDDISRVQEPDQSVVLSEWLTTLPQEVAAHNMGAHPLVPAGDLAQLGQVSAPPITLKRILLNMAAPLIQQTEVHLDAAIAPPEQPQCFRIRFSWVNDETEAGLIRDLNRSARQPDGSAGLHWCITTARHYGAQIVLPEQDDNPAALLLDWPLVKGPGHEHAAS